MRTGLTGLVTGTCGSDQDAKTLYDSLRGLSGLARLAVPKGQPKDQNKTQPDLGRLLDGLQITQDAHKVNIHIQEPGRVSRYGPKSVVGAPLK